MRLAVVSLKDIELGERFRTDYGEKEMEDLKTSIMREGLIQPLAVMELEEGGFQLLAGGRRWHACNEIGEQQVPCRIYSSISELQQRSVELHENMTRKDMTWQELVLLKKEVHQLKIAEHGEKHSTDPKAEGWTKTRTAGIFGESVANTSRDLELADMVDVIPGLNNAQSKSEAQKLLRKYQRFAENEVVAKAISETAKKTPVDKLKAKLAESYIVGDAFEKLAELPDNCADFIEIDPPYGIDLDKQRKVKTSGSSTITYNEVAASEYQLFLANLFSQCYRVLSSTGWIICWFGPDPWYETVRDEMKKAGFKLAGIPGAWVKPSGQTMNPQTRLGNSYELFFYGAKGTAQLNKQGRANTFHFKLVSPEKKIHPTERPIELMEEVLQTFCMPGSQVVVPFAGSGNTLLAANNKQMTAFGYDLSKEYKDAYVIRVHSSEPGTYKSYV